MTSALFSSSDLRFSFFRVLHFSSTVWGSSRLCTSSYWLFLCFLFSIIFNSSRSVRSLFLNSFSRFLPPAILGSLSLSLSLRLPPSSLAPNRLSTTSQLSILQFDNIFILIDPINSILEITPPRSRIPAVFSSFLRVAGGKGCVSIFETSDPAIDQQRFPVVIIGRRGIGFLCYPLFFG